MHPQKTGWLVPSGKRLHSYGKSPFSMGKSTISMVIFYAANCEFHYQRVRSLNHLHEFTGEAAIPGRRMTAIDPALKFKLHEHADGVDNNQQAHHQFLHRLPVELSFCGSFFLLRLHRKPRLWDSRTSHSSTGQ